MKPKRHTLWICVCCCVCLCLLASCGSKPLSHHFSFREKSFCTEVRGKLGGVDFCAKLSAAPIAQGHAVCVEFLPLPQAAIDSALVGLTVRANCVRNARNEIVLRDAEVSYHGLRISASPDDSTIAGLLSPVTALLEGNEARTVQKTDTGYRITLGDSCCLDLDANGIPRAAEAEGLQFEILWWES